MKLDNEDRNYLDKHFGKVNDRITDNKVAITSLETSFNGHKNNQCQNIVRHWQTEGKILVILVSILGFLFAIYKYFSG